MWIHPSTTSVHVKDFLILINFFPSACALPLNELGLIILSQYECVGFLFFVWCYTTSHNENLGLVSENRMRIRALKATAAPRLLRTVSPNESKEKLGERRGRKTQREGGLSAWFELEHAHTESNQATERSVHWRLLCAFVFQGANEALHTFESTDIMKSLFSNLNPCILYGRSKKLWDSQTYKTWMVSLVLIRDKV